MTPTDDMTELSDSDYTRCTVTLHFVAGLTLCACMRACVCCISMISQSNTKSDKGDPENAQSKCKPHSSRRRRRRNPRCEPIVAWRFSEKTQLRRLRNNITIDLAKSRQLLSVISVFPKAKWSMSKHIIVFNPTGQSPFSRFYYFPRVSATLILRLFLPLECHPLLRSTNAPQKIYVYICKKL